MSARTAQRAHLESGLRRALRGNEFKLYYQPKVSLATGETIGTEALIRWVHPEQGMISPGQFIPIAEDCGLIVPIGEWVLREACRQNEVWRQSGAKAMPVAVNVSAAQFAQRNFLDVIKDALTQSGLPAHLLELELTESIIMRNAESTVAVLVAIKDMGIRVAIDDFGTGYSSLSYLKRFPIDTLKIDQSFVSALPGDADQAAITKAVIAMAKSLKRSVTAEGVETLAQLDFLTAQGCDDVQGYFLSRPIPADDIPGFRAHRSAHQLALAGAVIPA
jgi:diguanylate cyclase